MRLFHLVSLLILCTLCACNPFATDKKSEHRKDNPDTKVKDVELRKLRKVQDSLLEMRQKKSKQKGLDTLKPKQA